MARKKKNTSNVVLIILGLFILSFIVAMTVIFCVKDAVPDTLIQYTLGAGGVEALLLAAIKISKVIKGEKVSQEQEVDC
jgi:hypothetical protein